MPISLHHHRLAYTLTLMGLCLITTGFTTGIMAAETGGDDAARRLSATIPDLRITIDERLGVAGHIASPTSFLTGPDGGGGAVPKEAAATKAVAGVQHPVRVFLDRYPELFGGDSAILADATVARDDETAHSGLRTLAWQQRLDGIAIHRGVLIANLSARGELVAIGSHFVPHLATLKTAMVARQAVVNAPPRDAVAALGAALASLDASADGIVASAIGKDAEQTQSLVANDALGAVHAHLVWYARAANDLRLAWNFILTQRGTGIMYELVVDAQDLTVHERITRTSPGLFNPRRVKPADARVAAPRQAGNVAGAVTKAATISARAVTKAADTIRLNVFTGDSPAPLSPGWPNDVGQSQPATVARTLVQLASLDATASPNGWIDANHDTRGNNVDAHTDLNFDNIADTPRPLATGDGSSGNPWTFDFPLNLSQPPSAYRSAAVTNLFYWCNVAHDRLYQLGFTETAGNFQNNNFSRGGQGNDAVQADAQDGEGTNNANFSTPSDGQPGRMQMYVFTSATPDRDGDLDSTIVLHEYGHGVSSRLVASGVSGNLNALQSGGMGEGWSDFYALSLLSQAGDNPAGTYAVGSYVTQDYFSGIRRYPYCIEPGLAVTAASTNPLTFSDIVSNSEVHDQGEVWCMMLWEARGELIATYGTAAGNDLMLRLVTDGLKLTPASPTFVAARDAIMQADAVANAGINQAALWRAFAKRGLGFGAVAGASSSTAGAQESYDTTDQFRVSNPAGMLAGGSPGGAFAPSSSVFTLTNPSDVSIAWTATKNRNWVSLSSGGGTIAAHGTTTVTVSLAAAANSLAQGTWRDVVAFSDTAHGITVTRPVTLKVLTNYTVTVSSATFAWIDPSAHASISLGDDSLSTARTLSFSSPFDFYGNSYSAVFVSSNGLLGFGATADPAWAAFENGPLPTVAVPNNLIAGMWDDLNPTANGSIHAAFVAADGVNPNRYVVSWVGVPQFNAPTSGLSFQIILEEGSNDIVCQYLEVQTALATYGAGRSATIGVEDGDGVIAKTYSVNGTTPLTNNLALRFHRTPGAAPPANAAPTVATAAAAGSANPLTTASTTLSVLGADDGGEANLIYTWSLAGIQSSTVHFSASGTHAASATTATFALPGSYPLRVTITDAGGLSVTSDVTVTAVSSFTSLAVSPTTPTVLLAATQQFSVAALDQFGATVALPAIVWSATPANGTINTSGLYTATLNGTTTITASGGGRTGSATVTTPAPVMAVSESPHKKKCGLGFGLFSLVGTMLLALRCLVLHGRQHDRV